VVAFVMFPLARELFRVADIPKRLIPATIALGIFTFTMTALPGSPQIQNIIPGQFFGTSSFAAPGVGLLGSVMILAMGMAWLEYRRRSLLRSGEHFDGRSAPAGAEGADAASGGGARADAARGTSADGTGADGSGGSGSGGTGGSGSGSNGERATAPADGNAPVLTLDGEEIEPETSRSEDPSANALTPPNAWVPFLPLLAVFVVNFGCTLLIFPAMDWGYLSEEMYGGIGLDDRAAMWAVILGLAAAIVLLTLLHLRSFGRLRSGFVDGVKGSLLPIMSVASEVGYGAVVASVTAFAVIRDAMFDVPGNALVTSVVSTSATAAITGSSSGGMTIALNAFGEDLRLLAEQQGISMEAMHRLTAMASGGLDTLPHSGAVVTLLIVCGMTHRQSYKDLAVMTVVVPVITVVVLVALVSAVGSF
jgi:H+/gluconate symporter-like permease